LTYLTLATRNTTACLQQKPQIEQTDKQGATKLLSKYLLMVTFEYGKCYAVQFKISNNGPVFDSVQNEKMLFTQH